MITSGTEGTCQWIIDDNGKLTIGSGKITHSTTSETDWTWYPYRYQIRKVDASASITWANGANAYGMFSGCHSLTLLDVSGFDTSNVMDMRWMFEYCSNLTSLNVSGFDTSNVMYMRGMFYYCSALPSLDVSGFDTSNVVNMRDMFYSCRNLAYLELHVSNSIAVIDTNSIFTGTTCPIYIINATNQSYVADAWRAISADYSNVHYEVDDLIINYTNQIYRYLLPNEMIGDGIYLASNIIFESNGLLPRSWSQNYNISASSVKINSTSQTVTWNRLDSNKWQYYNIIQEFNNINYTQSLDVTFSYNGKGEKNITSSVTYEHPESLIYASFQDGDYLYYITDEVEKKVTAFVYDKTKTSYSNLTNEVDYDNQTYTLTELREYIDGVPSKGCYENCINLINSPSISNLTFITSLERCFQNCSSLQSFGIAPTFDTIPSRVTNISNCFKGCSSLTGNINVLPIENDVSTLAFANTALPIYIVGGEVDPSNREKLEQTWRDIVGPYGNVHFEADDNQVPSLNINSLIRGKYENNQWTDSDEATHIKGIISYSNFDNYLPVGWSKINLTKDNISIYDDDSPATVIWETDSNTIFYILLTTEPELTHEIRIDINDTFHTTSVSRAVIGLFAMIDFVPGGKGMAIGSVASRNGLEITLPTTIGEGLLVPTTTDEITGKETVNLKKSQLVVGHYNEQDDSALFIIGNGQSGQRSNLFVVDEYGKLKIKDGFAITNGDISFITLNNKGIQIGNQESFHIEISNTELGFWNGINTPETQHNKIAYLDGSQLYITKSVVLQRMDLGIPVFDDGLGQWSWEVHPNGQNPSRNNLNLKWRG